MAINDKTHQPVQALSIKALEDLPANRFVSHLGGLCEADTKALGVTELAWATGEYSAVVVLGTAVVETSTSVSTGEDVTADTNGKAKPLTAAEPVNGRALNSCTGAGFVTIKLVP
ncbi:MAG: hypothetical protein ACLFQU_04990 [Candidatus Kapaibacterium sp.]